MAKHLVRAGIVGVTFFVGTYVFGQVLFDRDTSVAQALLMGIAAFAGWSLAAGISERRRR